MKITNNTIRLLRAAIDHGNSINREAANKTDSDIDSAHILKHKKLTEEYTRAEAAQRAALKAMRGVGIEPCYDGFRIGDAKKAKLKRADKRHVKLEVVIAKIAAASAADGKTILAECGVLI